MPDYEEMMNDDSENGGSGAELKQFVTRFETLEDEKASIAEDQKQLVEEIGARGYDKKVFRKLIALRKMDPDKRAEEEAVLDLYKDAVGMS